MHSPSDIPTAEPAVITAGDTVKWTRTLDHYPATGGWVLTYALRGAGKIDLTAAASGADHAITISAAATAAYTAGFYTWQAYATKAATSERYPVASGTLEIEPNLAAVTASTYEWRTEAKIIYDQLVAAYKTYTTSQGHVQEYTIGSRRMTFRSAAEIIKQIEYWKAQVQAEERAQGLGQGRNVFVRFSN
ncbi:MAG: hypothetical protein ACREU9_00185 [Gammaproteobacteria bacterium]